MIATSSVDTGMVGLWTDKLGADLKTSLTNIAVHIQYRLYRCDTSACLRTQTSSFFNADHKMNSDALQEAKRKAEEYRKGTSMRNYRDILLLTIGLDEEWQKELEINSAENKLCGNIMSKIDKVEMAIKDLENEIDKTEQHVKMLEEHVANGAAAGRSSS